MTEDMESGEGLCRVDAFLVLVFETEEGAKAFNQLVSRRRPFGFDLGAPESQHDLVARLDFWFSEVPGRLLEDAEDSSPLGIADRARGSGHTVSVEVAARQNRAYRQRAMVRKQSSTPIADQVPPHCRGVPLREAKESVEAIFVVFCSSGVS